MNGVSMMKRKEMEMEEEIVIVGGGIAGLTTALGLHRLGLRSLVLEASYSLRVAGFAFATWDNAWKALDAVGVGDSLRQQSSLLQSLVIMSASSGALTSEISLSSYTGTRDHEFRCLRRKDLLQTLAKELPTNTIRFSSKVVSIEECGPFFKLLRLADGTTIKTKVLIGCDGVNSAVGRFLGLQKPYPTSRCAIRGFVDFKKSHGFEPKFMQFMGDGVRYGVVPIDDTSLYWFFIAFTSSGCGDKELQDSPMKMKQFVLSNLGKTTGQVKVVIENTKPEDILCSPLRLRLPWEAIWGNITKGTVCVAGDAFHPMTPDLGQGACSSLEDSVVLARCLGQALWSTKGTTCDKVEEYERITAGLEKYAKERRWRVVDLTTTAYVMGFLEQSNSMMIKFLRDRVLSSYLNGLLLKKGTFDSGELSCKA